MENITEILYVVIAILSVLSAGLITFALRQFLVSRNVVPNEAQSVIQEYQTRIQGLQTNVQESQGIIQEHQAIIQKLQNQLKLKDKRSWQAGQNSANGGVAEFLGYLGLGIIQKFDILCMLTSTSKKPSVDAIGFDDECITFLEFKKSGANLTPKENIVKRLIMEGKVDYKIIDVNIPNNLTEVRNVSEKEANLCRIQN